MSTLGQLARHPRVSALRRFITGWYLSYLTADSTRAPQEAGPQERLSATGDNLPNADIMADGRLLLRIKDAPFDQPVLAKFASAGTLKMLAYHAVLYDPETPPLIGIEEPENHLHPRLLPELAEECRMASSRAQLLVSTHSPFFVNSLRPEEVRVLYRNDQGYTQAKRAADMRGVRAFVEQGALLGDLWVEGYFEVGDPLTASGGSNRLPSAHMEPGRNRSRSFQVFRDGLRSLAAAGATTRSEPAGRSARG